MSDTALSLMSFDLPWAKRVVPEPKKSRPVESSERIRVAVRITGGTRYREDVKAASKDDELEKPLSSRSVFDRLSATEVAIDAQAAKNWIEFDETKVTVGPNVFEYDKVLSDLCSQQDVFEHTVKPLLSRAFQGFNIGVIMYGMTGSGKTYTMYGEDDIDGKSTGIIQRSLTMIGDLSQQTRLQKMELSMTEIYMEKLYDLICSTSPMATSEEIRSKLQTPQKAFNYYEFSEIALLSDTIRLAITRRHVNSQKLNRESSRGHVVCRLRLSFNDGESDLISILDFVDLCGSEDLRQSMAEGAVKKETISINKSLTQLITVIDNINHGRTPGYRNSLLTNHIRPCLGENALVQFIVCCNPLAAYYLHSRKSLEFGLSCRSVKVKAHKNIRLSYDELVRRMNAYKTKSEQLEVQCEELMLLLRKHNIEVPPDIARQVPWVSSGNSSVRSTASTQAASLVDEAFIERKLAATEDEPITVSCQPSGKANEPVQGIDQSSVGKADKGVGTLVWPMRINSTQTDAVQIRSTETQTLKDSTQATEPEVYERKDPTVPVTPQDDGQLDASAVNGHSEVALAVSAVTSLRKARRSTTQIDTSTNGLDGSVASLLKMSTIDLDSRVERTNSRVRELLGEGNTSVKRAVHKFSSVRDLTDSTFVDPSQPPLITREGLTPRQLELTNEVLRSLLDFIAVVNNRIKQHSEFYDT